MRVLVATDLSEAGDLALQQGAAMTASTGDLLAVVHAIPAMVREGFFHEHDDIREARSRQVVERATAAVCEKVARLAPNAAETFIDEGAAYASVIRRAETWQADVIVVASSGHSGLMRLVGDVATKVIRHAHCSVLVVRPSASRGYVLAGIDFSDQSLAALSAAAMEAKRRGAKLKIVHSLGYLDDEALYILELGTPSISKAKPEQERLLSMMRDSLAKIGVEGGECQILEAPAPSAIVRDAESIGAELVVVGYRGRTGLARLSIGGVAEKVVRTAPCSVLVVRRPETAHHT